MAEIPTLLTPVSEVDLGLGLKNGHRLAFNVDPSEKRLRVGWAQTALETARGKVIRNNNVGNITKGAWSGNFYVLHVPPPDPPMLNFRAYDSLVDGCCDYWKFLSVHYAGALGCFDDGDADKAARALKAAGYFTAGVEAYAKAMVQLAAYFDDKVFPLIPDGVPCPLAMKSVLSDEDIEKVMAVVEENTEIIIRDFETEPPPDDPAA